MRVPSRLMVLTLLLPTKVTITMSKSSRLTAARSYLETKVGRTLFLTLHSQSKKVNMTCGRQVSSISLTGASKTRRREKAFSEKLALNARSAASPLMMLAMHMAVELMLASTFGLGETCNRY